MAWHFEILTVNGRRFLSGDNYADRSPFASILTIQFRNQKEAYISGMLNDGTRGPIHREDWRELRDGLRKQFGVELIEAEHSNEPFSVPTGPAPLI